MEDTTVNGIRVNPNDHELINFLKQQKAGFPEEQANNLSPEQQFIRRLQATRLERKMSQTALAQKTGLPQSAIARIEAGKGNPTLATLSKLASALDCQLTLLHK